MSNKFNLDCMSVDQMWELRDKVIEALSAKLTAEKRQLERRLAELHRDRHGHALSAKSLTGDQKNRLLEKRKYPQVVAKYQNPNSPTETWSGRGKQPRWLSSAIAAGHAIDEFVIGVDCPGA